MLIPLTENQIADRDDYNKKLQVVQAIECQTGFKILEPFVFRDKDGRIAECGYDYKHRTVFRQVNPFRENVRYEVDEIAWREIVYADPTR